MPGIKPSLAERDAWWTNVRKPLSSNDSA